MRKNNYLFVYGGVETLKKFLFILLFAVFPLLSFLGCATTSGINSEKTSDGFIKSFDEITGVTSYVHKDLQVNTMGLYNLRDNIAGERENFSISIKNNFIFVNCDYQYNDWLFINSFVIYSGDLRIEKSLKRISSNPAKGVYSVYVRENGYCSLSNEEIEMLEKICNSSDVKICFIGSKYRTDVFTVKSKIKKAIIATIEKWRKMPKSEN